MGTYIEKLHASSVGLFDELDIEFNPKFNFITGVNGSGKTSILRCISLALSPVQASAFRYKDDSEVWVEGEADKLKLRIGIGKGWVRNGKDYRKAELFSWIAPPTIENRKSINSKGLNRENINFTPLILGAYRRIEYKEINGMVRENSIFENRRNFRNNALASIVGGYLPDVKQWMINRYFQIEKAWAHRFMTNWNWLLDNLHLLAPFDSEFRFKEIKQDLEPIFEIFGKECYLEELSAGFQAILSLILGIFKWIETTNENDDMIVQNATGMVIIDELDVHLHPEWQLTIRKTLEEIFPKLQFIVTTHSPHLIATAKAGELIILPKHDGKLNIKPSQRCFSGWNTDQILEEVMGVTNLENKLYATLISKAMELVQDKKLPELKDIVSDIEKVSHPSDTIVSVLKIKIASLELGE